MSSDPSKDIASLVLAHLCAYTELVRCDLIAAQRAWLRKAWIATGLAGSVLLAAALGCAWIIAERWDTPARFATLQALVMGFAVLAALLFWLLLKPRLADEALFGSTAVEWRKDQQLVSDLLSKASGR